VAPDDHKLVNDVLWQVHRLTHPMPKIKTKVFVCGDFYNLVCEGFNLNLKLGDVLVKIHSLDTRVRDCWINPESGSLTVKIWKHAKKAYLRGKPNHWYRIAHDLIGSTDDYKDMMADRSRQPVTIGGGSEQPSRSGSTSFGSSLLNAMTPPPLKRKR
jgi:hypothetical protein